jgi:hypothetical protein
VRRSKRIAKLPWEIAYKEAESMLYVGAERNMWRTEINW